MNDPLWLRLILATLPAIIGALTALSGVLVAQIYAGRERRFRVLENLTIPFLNAHQEMYGSLVELQDSVHDKELRNRLSQKLIPHFKRQLLWLQDDAATPILDLIETLTNNNAKDISDDSDLEAIKKKIVICQRSLRKAIAIPDFIHAIDNKDK